MRTNTRPDGRPLTFIEEARRAQIIACTIEVLAELGYAQTSLARIAERAGISKGVIAYHFAGKDELLEQVIRTVYADGARYVGPQVQAEASAPGMLAAYVRASLEFIRDHRQAMAAVTEIVLNLRAGDGGLRFRGGPLGLEAMLGPLQALLHEGQAAGLFVAFDTRAMAWSIRTLIDSVNRQQALDPQLGFDTCIRELLGLVERATRRVDP